MSTRLFAPLAAIAFLGACNPDDDGAPALNDAYDGDDDLDVVDRREALRDADDPDHVSSHAGLDFGAAPGEFYMQVPGAYDGLEEPRSSYGNVVQAIAMVAVADVITVAVVAPPAAAIAIVRDGEVEQVDDNVWVATNTVYDGHQSVTGVFTTIWVGTGWLGEMRLTSEDGEWSDERWFSGYISLDHDLGWWDLYDSDGTRVGVVEWTDDDAGNAQLGIAALDGDAAGDVLVWATNDEGTAAVAYRDDSRDEAAWVRVFADQSGELRSPDYNGGELACWSGWDDAEPFADAVCVP